MNELGGFLWPLVHPAYPGLFSKRSRIRELMASGVVKLAYAWGHRGGRNVCGAAKANPAGALAHQAPFPNAARVVGKLLQAAPAELFEGPDHLRRGARLA